MAKQILSTDPTSVVMRCKLLNSSVTTGAGLTGLTSASSGLIISTIKIGEATATAYTVAGSTIETITTLGTYAAPTATKCRFKEVDATNHKGLYELQFADARFASTSSLIVSLSGATNLAEADFEVQTANISCDVIKVGGTSQTAGDIIGKLNNPAGFKKNTAVAAFPFVMRSSTTPFDPTTGLTVTATRSIDGGAFATCANAVTETGNGWYRITLAATDMNGDTIAFKFSATGAKTLNFTIVTEP